MMLFILTHERTLPTWTRLHIAVLVLHWWAAARHGGALPFRSWASASPGAVAFSATLRAGRPGFPRWPAGTRSGSHHGRLKKLCDERWGGKIVESFWWDQTNCAILSMLKGRKFVSCLIMRFWEVWKTPIGLQYAGCNLDGLCVKEV